MKCLRGLCVAAPYRRWQSSFRLLQPFERGSVSPDTLEHPNPIVFIAGEGLTHEIWSDSADYFSRRGFCTLSMNDPNLPPEKAVDFLQESISRSGLTCPVVVAHSASSFLAQKFLESYNAQGLALVAPWPPSSGRLARLRRVAWEQTVFGDDISGDTTEARVLRYHGYRSSTKNETGTLVKDNLTFPLILQELAEHGEKHDLNLEIGVVPTLLIMTADSVQMSEEEHHSLLLQHSVPEEWIVNLNGDGLPMLHAERCERMNIALFQFIDEITM